MKCFYHHDRDAVGTCKSCQRGLCPECAVDLDRGLACPSRCEQDVRAVIQLVQNNVRLSPTSVSLIRSSRRGGMMGAGFAIILGALFVVWGIITPHLHFITVLGGVYFVFGLISLVRVMRITAPAPADPRDSVP